MRLYQEDLIMCFSNDKFTILHLPSLKNMKSEDINYYNSTM